MRGGGLERAIIQWKGYTFDEEQNVVPENKWIKDGKIVDEGVEGARQYKEPWHVLGGLRLYGIWPIEDIYTYDFKWSGVMEDGEIVHHPKERLDYILLKDDVYWAKVEQAEDKALLPLDVEIVLTIRVINPRKARFRIQNWLETVINRVKPSVRNAMTKATFEKLITERKPIGEEVYNELNEKGGLFEEFRDRYGVDVRKLEVKEINPPEGYREATLKPWLGEQEARTRGAETVGSIIQMMSSATGKTPKQIRREIQKDPVLKKEFRELSQDLIKRKMAIDGKSFVDIRVVGAKGVERSLLNLVALFNKMSGGAGTPLGKEKREAPEAKIKSAQEILERDKKKYAQKG